MIMMCRCRFMDCDKSTSLVGDVDGGEVMCGRGQRVHGKSLDLLLYFAVNFKLL